MPGRLIEARKGGIYQQCYTEFLLPKLVVKGHKTQGVVVREVKSLHLRKGKPAKTRSKIIRAVSGSRTAAWPRARGISVPYIVAKGSRSRFWGGHVPQ